MLDTCKPSLFIVLQEENTLAGVITPSKDFQFHYYIHVKERKAKITPR